MIRQLKKLVAENIDLDNLSEEELGKHLDLALNNLNLGSMYVPMEKNPSNSKAVSRENTDYDTFGSIDSLIFEPKLPTHEDIAEAQEEITQSFEYLENEDDGQEELVDNNNNNNNRNIQAKVKQFEKPQQVNPGQRRKSSPKLEKNALAVGQTSFAERVKLFQSLGSGSDRRTGAAGAGGAGGSDRRTGGVVKSETEKTQSVESRRDSPMLKSPGHEPGHEMREKPPAQTTWREQANKKSDRSGNTHL